MQSIKVISRHGSEEIHHRTDDPVSHRMFAGSSSEYSRSLAFQTSLNNVLKFRKSSRLNSRSKTLSISLMIRRFSKNHTCQGESRAPVSSMSLMRSMRSNRSKVLIHSSSK